MTTEERWMILKNTAAEQLSLIDKLSLNESFIEYYCEPSFEPFFKLQITWTDKIVKWYYTEWDIVADRSKFYELDGMTKVVLIQPQPTIKITSGAITPGMFADIIAHIRQMKISPKIDPLHMFTLDGSFNTLSLGIGDVKTIYSWHTLPNEWNDIEKLVDMILAIKNSSTD
ncbi:hypothetical protein [Ferruginibacter sp.]